MTMTQTIGEAVGSALDDPKPFNLREYVRSFLADTDEPDPAKVAAAIAADLTMSEREVALLVMLPDYVRSVVGSLGANTRKPSRQSLTTPQRVRAWYSQTLASRLFNGQEWKFLADCTADDLQGAAAERYKTASATHAEGDRLVKLANLLEETGRDTVSDVPEDELRATLGDAS